MFETVIRWLGQADHDFENAQKMAYTIYVSLAVSKQPRKFSRRSTFN